MTDKQNQLVSTSNFNNYQCPAQYKVTDGKLPANQIEPIHLRITDESIQNQFISNLKKDIQTLDEQTLIRTNLLIKITERFNEEQLIHFLKGGHFIIKDNGKLYDILSVHGYERISTHHWDDKPASDIGIIAGHTFAHLLVGRRSDSTWFQIEKSPMPKLTEIASNANDLKHLIDHSIDSIIYITCRIIPWLTPHNIGQYGTSHHLDYNPIVIEEHMLIEEQDYQTLQDTFLL